MSLFPRQPAGFVDRVDAGQQLARRLADLAGQPEVVVLGLPRGGVVVAYQVARVLGAPLRAFLVRKLGAPDNPELALGALAASGTLVVDQRLVAELRVPAGYIESEIGRQRQALKEQAEGLRGWIELAPLSERTVVVVDDGVATGSTMAAALRALRAEGPRSLVLGIPVGPPEVLRQLARLADRVEAVLRPDTVYGVGAWYQDFRQVSDTEVQRLLTAAEASRTAPKPSVENSGPDCPTADAA